MSGQGKLGGIKFLTDAERNRVADLIDRDVLDRDRENRLRMATLAAASGDYRSLSDTIIDPTPEQLAKAEFEPYLPPKKLWTDRTLPAVRRVLNPMVSRMWKRGVLSADEVRACLWYKDCHEMSGFVGHVISCDYTRQVFTPYSARVPFTDNQIDAQKAFRFARDRLPSRFIAFFDMVVINNIAVHRAARIKPSGRHPVATFRRLASTVEQAWTDWKDGTRT